MPSYPNPKHVISTEAAHAFVSSAVERSLYFASAVVPAVPAVSANQNPVKPKIHENQRQIRTKRLSHEFHPIRYTGYRAIKQTNPQPALGFSFGVSKP
jgi:hypothetical protein